MAIVCCNLLLGYTLLKTDATASASGDFILSADGVELIHDSWNECFATIKADPEKTYTVKMQSSWRPTTQIVLNEGTGCNIIFDLNGFTLDGSAYGHTYLSEESFFHTNNNGNKVYFEFTDSSVEQKGTVENFTATIFAGSNAGETELVISGGIFTQNKADIVWNNVTMTGGLITQNNSVNSIIEANNFIVITGGEISNNIARGGIYTNANLDFTGGKIINNTTTATSSSCFVRCAAVSGYFKMTGGEIANNICPDGVQPAGMQVYLGNKDGGSTATMTGGKIVGTVLVNNAEFELGDNIQKTDEGYFEKVHTWGEWVVDENPTPDHAGSHYHECTTCYETEREDITLTLEKITVSSKQESYAVGDEADLMVAGIYTRSDTGAEVSYELTAEQYSVIPNDLTLSLGENILTILYNGETATKTATIKIFVAEPEVPDDGEDVETPDDGNDDQTPTTPDEQPTPETPKAETPENNTPWIMLFVGIGVGAVLLVGGITLGVVLSKRKSK